MKTICNWCQDLEVQLEELKNNDYTGVSIGKTNYFYPWDKTEIDKISIQLWYDREHGMEKRDFLVELGMKEENGSGTRMVAPIKYCPNCGRKLKY